jgi:hypothetical protein
MELKEFHDAPPNMMTEIRTLSSETRVVSGLLGNPTVREAQFRKTEKRRNRRG